MNFGSGISCLDRSCATVPDGAGQDRVFNTVPIIGDLTKLETGSVVANEQLQRVL